MTKINSKKVLGSLILVLMLMAFVQPATSYAKSEVAVVNYQLLFNNHPDRAKALASINAATQQMQNDFNQQAPNLTEQGRQAYWQQANQLLEQRKAQIIAAINNNILAAIKDVANDKGITTVIDSKNVLYGGYDITSDVWQKITGKKQ